MALPKIFKNIDARVKKAGDTMSGDLLINKDAPCNIIMTCNNSGRQSAFSSTGDGFTSLYNEDPNDVSNNRVALWLGSEDVENDRLFRINRRINGANETFKIYGEHFKPTPTDIGALKIYKTFAELGLEEATATAAMIVNAMDNQSMLITYMGENATTSALAPPWTYGTLRVTKFSSKYTMFEYQATSDDTTGLKLVRGYYNDGASITAIWSGWNKIVDDRNVISLLKESVISGTVAGDRKGLLIYGNTYGNNSDQIKTPGKISYGDPGPQIVFNTANSITEGQPLALIYSDNDSIANGTSLSLVSTETDTWFIAPSIKGKNFYITDSNNIEAGKIYVSTTGTASAVGLSRLNLGNEIQEGTASNARGVIRLYSNNQYYTELWSFKNQTENITLNLPRTGGGWLLTSNENYFSQKDLIFDISNYVTGNPDKNLNTWKTNSGKLVFRTEKGSDSQDIYLIPNQYDNVCDNAGFTVAGKQGKEYLWAMGNLLTNSGLIVNNYYNNDGSPKSAGEITNSPIISYTYNPTGTSTTKDILTVYGPANTYGVMPVLGGCASTVIAAGESCTAFPQIAMKEDGIAHDSEVLCLVADNNVKIYTNCDNIANRKGPFTFTNTGALVVPVNTDYTTFKARNIAAGTSSASISNNGDMYVRY